MAASYIDLLTARATDRTSPQILRLRSLYGTATLSNRYAGIRPSSSHIMAEQATHSHTLGRLGDPDDENTADAEGILHIANWLLGYLEQFL